MKEILFKIFYLKVCVVSFRLQNTFRTNQEIWTSIVINCTNLTVLFLSSIPGSLIQSITTFVSCSIELQAELLKHLTKRNVKRIKVIFTSTFLMIFYILGLWVLHKLISSIPKIIANLVLILH